MKVSKGKPSKEGLIMLECLRKTVAKTIERKKKLGHYYVIWDGEKPVAIGPDAPASLRPE